MTGYKVIDFASFSGRKIVAHISRAQYVALGEKDGIQRAHRDAFGGSNPAWCHLFDEYYAVELLPKDGQPASEVVKRFDEALAMTLAPKIS